MAKKLGYVYTYFSSRITRKSFKKIDDPINTTCEF